MFPFQQRSILAKSQREREMDKLKKNSEMKSVPVTVQTLLQRNSLQKTAQTPNIPSSLEKHGQTGRKPTKTQSRKSCFETTNLKRLKPLPVKNG